jgi:hypothetical protein
MEHSVIWTWGEFLQSNSSDFRHFIPSDVSASLIGAINLFALLLTIPPINASVEQTTPQVAIFQMKL